MNQYLLGGLPLAAVAGHSVSVVKMRMLADVESNLAAGIHLNSKVTLRVDLFDSAKITISNLQFV
jgi:hypothetical protein